LPLQVEAAEPETEDMPDLLVPVPPTQREAGPPIFPFAEPQTVSGQIRAVPLFTPDAHSYFDFVTKVVQNTKHTLWLENQSLSPKLGDDTYMNELFLVLADMTHNNDIDVRIIVRSDFDPWKIQERLQASNVNLEKVKYLTNVHTKGLIIDNELVVIGSHNWTSQGVQSNRDASIAFYNQDIISYFSDLFNRDWDRADPKPGPGARLAGPGPAPAGFAKVPWSAVIEN
jgi:PLD-like domain